jgi:hypothetical protein
VGFLFLPHAATSQSVTTGSIAGVVRDMTGAVLPGVTVEAASPALIEKTRTAVTYQQGNYKIVDLRPGVYSVGFGLTGFSSVRREGIELTTGFTATVNAEMRVGSVEETITVSGASPVVDTQNIRTQSVFSRETLDALPTLKSLQGYAALTLGANFSSAADQDVGGSRGEFPGSGGFIVHNSRAADNRMTIDGMLFSSLIGELAAANKGQFINQLMVEETAIQTSGGSAEYQTGGVYMNIVPKSGGNAFATTFAVNGTGGDLQSSNLNDELRARGVSTPPNVKKIYDVGGATGGPLRKDRLWFITAHRWWGTQNTVPGSYYSASQHTLFYTPDLSRPAFTDLPHRDSSVRLTWQAAQKHKITGSESIQKATMFWQIDQPFRAPEAAIHQQYPNSVTQLMWSFPATNRLLFEAGATILRAEQNNFRMAGVRSDDIPVTELSTGLNYNARAAIPAMNTTDAGEGQRRDQSNQRVSMSYVTGSHAVKVGLYAMEGWGFNHTAVNETPYGPIGFSFRLGAPVGITQWASPFDVTYRLMPDLGLYAQDQWTVKRLTLNVGLRYDHVRQYAPAQRQQSNLFVSARDFPALDDTPNFNDISPRLGAAYDLFGTGRTAIKVSAGRYVSAEAAALVLANAPAARIATGATRIWTDGNGNFVPECSLVNPLANGECGRLSNVNLGLPVPSTNYADDVLRGWGRRRFMWQSAIALQQELRPGMALNVGYFRTWHGNFTVTANQAAAPSDFNSFCVTAPADGRLGDASARQICGLYDVIAPRFGQVSNLVQPAANFGEQYDRYDGFDVALNARFRRGGLLTGGVNTGRTVSDNCAVVQNNPQIGLLVAGGAASPTERAFCHVVLPWSAQTQVKLAGSYPLPWWGLQVSGTYQNLPGIPVFANYVATNAEIAPSLGRNLSSCPTATGPCSAIATIALIVPNTLFEDRFGQFDVRLAKTLRIGRARLQGQLDVYNLFNASSVLAESFAYGANWLRPSGVLSARLVKLGAQVDF